MTRKSLFDLRVANRRQPLLLNPRGEANESMAAVAKTKTTRGWARLAEAARLVAADYAALRCCCPCTIVNLLVLAVYRVPAGRCRGMRRRRQRSVAAKRKKKGQNLCAMAACGCCLQPDLLRSVEGGRAREKEWSDWFFFPPTKKIHKRKGNTGHLPAGTATSFLVLRCQSKRAGSFSSPLIGPHQKIRPHGEDRT
ncbi:uncharacterized protein J3R85_011640 [Psidium guajava]|nr:uncharacterized protein J3R85_011640 [Psidium guajava]